MSMVRLLTGAAFLATLSTPALAQDWTGGYISGHVGGIHQDGDADERLVFDRDLDGSFNDTVTLPGGGDAFAPGFCGGAATGTANANCSNDDEGVDAGVRLGYDWQQGAWVYGVLGELSGMDADDSVSGFSTTPASYTFTRDLNFVFAVRARAGRLFGPYLGYVTGGLAVGDVDQSFTTSNGLNDFNPRSNTDNPLGHQWGLGIERRVGAHWSLGLEYLHTSLDDDDETTVRVSQGMAGGANPFILAPNTTGTDVRRSDQDFEFNSVRATMAYRF